MFVVGGLGDRLRLLDRPPPCKAMRVPLATVRIAPDRFFLPPPHGPLGRGEGEESGEGPRPSDGLRFLFSIQASRSGRLASAFPGGKLRETAQILAAAWGVPVEVDERLKERGQGPLEGRTGVEVAALREAWRQFEQDPTAEIAGVEPRAVFAARVWAAMQAAMDRPERALAIVAHGGT
ncbi:MAG: histidine phosphatase family protein, partial [Anaerolineae bacterium]|uniref:histidine phosphatase family protein n=1 Tax=Thermoflexus sp. TaxID=1969742 RepID=UPI0025F70368